MKNLVIYLVLIILAGGGGFYGGTVYQKNKITQNPRSLFESMRPDGNFPSGPNSGTQTGAVRRQFGGGGQITGEITSSDDKSITVKTQDGSSKIIILSSKTSINKASEAATSDLKVGEKVAAFGTTNSDGSVTAQNIQLNPIVRVAPSQNNN